MGCAVPLLDERVVADDGSPLLSLLLFSVLLLLLLLLLLSRLRPVSTALDFPLDYTVSVFVLLRLDCRANALEIEFTALGGALAVRASSCLATDVLFSERAVVLVVKAFPLPFPRVDRRTGLFFTGTVAPAALDSFWVVLALIVD